MSKRQKRFISKEAQNLGLAAIEIIVDTETGVNYILTHSPDGVSPLLDRDGKPIVDDISQYAEQK